MTEILVIDDDPREGLAGLLGATWKHPRDVSEQDVYDADLIVIDQYLRDWTFTAETPATMHPRGGLAVAAVLRSQLEQSHTPFVIFTGGLDDLGQQLPRAIRRPVLASSFGVEWVADRNDPRLVDQLFELATGAESLPAGWDTHDSLDAAVARWLAIPADAEWSSNALVDIHECRPQTTGAAGDSPGMVFLRWFVQQVLPFPTFLLDVPRAAVRLGVDPAEFETILAEDSTTLGSRLAEARYEGHLASFLGPRFWRAGIDWVLTASDSWVRGDASDSDALSELGGREVPVLGSAVWRVPVDGDLELLEPREIHELTRILPDHWPAFADDAYALVEDAEVDERIDLWRSRLS